MRSIHQNSLLAEQPIILREFEGSRLPNADVVDKALPGGVEHARVITKVVRACYRYARAYGRLLNI